MAQKLLQLIGALAEPWPLGTKQNFENQPKKNDSGGSGMAQTLLILIGALRKP